MHKELQFLFVIVINTKYYFILDFVMHGYCTSLSCN